MRKTELSNLPKIQDNDTNSHGARTIDATYRTQIKIVPLKRMYKQKKIIMYSNMCREEFQLEEKIIYETYYEDNSTKIISDKKFFYNILRLHNRINKIK